MAIRTQPLSALLRVGAGAATAVVLALVVATLGAVVLRAGGFGALGPGDWAAIRFTISQAVVSAGLSLLLAIPIARALARRRFRGRAVLITLLGAPFILPVIVAVMGLLAIFGRAGVLNDVLAAIGFERISIYGYTGVVLAHVFFNLPLAVRLLLQGWLSIPAERFRLAASLGFGSSEVQRFLERPMLRALAPGVFVTIFLICLTSFAVALTLGGGPRATTVELAIYQAFRFDFDLARAASLALVQVGLCLAALAITARATLPSGFGAGLDRVAPILPRGAGMLARDIAAITGATAFLLVPIGAVLLRGLPAFADLPASLWQAVGVSVALALASTVLTIGLALPLALAAVRHRWAEAAAMLPLTASSLVIGTGLFLIVRPYVNPTALALPVTLIANAAMTLPFAVRTILPEARVLAEDYDRLAASLGLRGFARLRYLTLPRLARPIGFSAGLAAAFSMGDLGVITLFSDGETQTLPLALFQLMGAYRMDQAAAAAALLMALTFALFWAFDRIGHHADPR